MRSWHHAFRRLSAVPSRLSGPSCRCGPIHPAGALVPTLCLPPGVAGIPVALTGHHLLRRGRSCSTSTLCSCGCSPRRLLARKPGSRSCVWTKTRRRMGTGRRTATPRKPASWSSQTAVRPKGCQWPWCFLPFAHSSWARSCSWLGWGLVTGRDRRQLHARRVASAVSWPEGCTGSLGSFGTSWRIW